MNLMLDGSLWRDLYDDVPPIWWNPDSEQFEILIDNDGSASGSFSIELVNPASSGDTINFDYNITHFDPAVGGQGFLVVRAIFGSGVVENIPIAGTTAGTVNIACEEGVYYRIYISGASGSDYYSNFYDLTMTLTGIPEPVPPTEYYVYEMEKGWSFDGNYIPHFLELNWYFGDNPFDYSNIQKLRIHGLAKGVVNLQVQFAGMQGDPATDYISDYMEPAFIDLPYTPIYVNSEFVPVTNYTDYSNRGLALQMKFSGRNTDITKPEPAHVLQVLALQESPDGNGKRSN